MLIQKIERQPIDSTSAKGDERAEVRRDAA
jgi:hypothetical protein